MKCFLFPTCAILLLIGCKNSDQFVIINKDQISTTDKSEIKVLTDSVYNCFIGRNTSYLRRISSKNAIKGMDVFDTFFNHYTFKNCPKEEMLSQFLVKCSPSSKLENASVDSFYFLFTPLKRYSYVYFMPIYTNDNRSMWQISCVFNKNGGDNWELDNLSLIFYKYDDKTAIEYYNDAIEKFNQGKYLEAWFIIHIAYNLTYPDQLGFHYMKEQELRNFSQRIFDTVRDKKILPWTIDQISSKPQIVNVGTQPYNGKLFPCIICQTNINIYDTVMIKNEGNEITKLINNYIPEINKTNDSIIYEFHGRANNLEHVQFVFFASSK